MAFRGYPPGMLLAISLLLNAFAFTGVLLFIRRKGGWKFLKSWLAARGVVRDRALETFENAYHQTRVELMRLFPPGSADVVLLGDSLTEGAPWHLLLPGVSLRNQGIAGDTVHGVRGRLACVGTPACVAVLIGINDLNRGKTSDELLGELKTLLEALKVRCPRVIVQSLLPIDGAVWGLAVAQRIRETNLGLYALTQDLALEWLDLHPLFLEGDRLAPHFTHDGLHLNARGYEAWARALAPKI